MLRSIPTSALVLLNLIVLIYVVRMRSRSQSGFFLAMSAIALIVWATGLEMWNSLGQAPWGLSLVGAAAMLVPANLVYFAATRPRVVIRGVPREALLPMAFLPTVAASLLDELGVLGRARVGHELVYSSWAALWASEGGAPLPMMGAYVVAAVGLLVAQLRQPLLDTERPLVQNLLIVAASPALFFALFSTFTTLAGMPLLPSPSLMLAFIAQLAILIVVRHEEVERPLLLSRWIYFTMMVLLGFVLGHLALIFYESMLQVTLLAPTVRWLLVGTITLFVLAACVPGVQAFFDRLMFRRAWEYRELVRAAQVELRETRQRLRRAERLSVVGEMAARIAHEIKNPLGPIKGYAQMMLEKIERTPDFPHRASFTRQLAIISEEVDTIDRKVRQLLDMVRTPDTARRREDINRLVERAAILLRLEVEATNTEPGGRTSQVRIHDDLETGLPLVACMVPRLEEAINNLCRNAIEALGDRGHIWLRTRRAPRGDAMGIEIEIEDDGPGFSPSAREHLFEPFYTEKAGGTGLGLSIVRGHIEAHDGEIAVAPGTNGAGTRITLWLPVDASDDEPTADAPSTPAPEGRFVLPPMFAREAAARAEPLPGRAVELLKQTEEP